MRPIILLLKRARAQPSRPLHHLSRLSRRFDAFAGALKGGRPLDGLMATLAPGAPLMWAFYAAAAVTFEPAATAALRTAAAPVVHGADGIPA
jgi:hypothetical protein